MLQRESPKLILASASPARRALLEAAGLRTIVQPAAIDEGAVKRAAHKKGAKPEVTALRLATLKAREVAAPDALVIGADQLLVCGKDWFDKPADVAGAGQQLRRLRGRTHILVTAVVCFGGGDTVWRHVAQPRLRMRNFSDEFLEAYLAMEGTEVTGSVGAYRLEGKGVQLFDRIEGDQAAILGLPMLPLLDFLRRAGLIMD
jgi:septum formation protein